MKSGYCLGCKRSALLAADYCDNCELTADRARYDAMIEAHLAKAGDDDDGDGQTT